MDKCTNTCCDKGTNTRDKEEDQEVSWSQASGDSTVVDHATKIKGLKVGRQIDKLIPIQAERLTGSQADRQTGRQADRQTGRQADRQTGRQADRQTGRQADRQTGRHADRLTG